MTVTLDELVARLIVAAEKAVRAEAGSLAFEIHRVRGVTLDLTVQADGKVEPARCYIERSLKPGRGNQ